jgi:prevent-host-death family protein
VAVEVGIKEFRAGLSDWLDRAAAGEEIVVTHRGKPKARLVRVDGRSTFDRMVEEGRITPPSAPKTPIDRRGQVRLGPGKSLSDYVIEQR